MDDDMDKFSYEILGELKKRMNKPNTCYQIEQIGESISARQFYLKELNDNLAEPMTEAVRVAFDKGSGNELEDKMKAIRSSSAMTYNLFLNGVATFKGKSYNVAYEKQFFTLKEDLRGKPANLDVLLTREDEKEIIACEMKMCEWIFNTPSKLKSAYLQRTSYQHEESADIFIEISNKLSRTTENTEYAPEYLSKTLQYDSFQMLKHTLALYNACRNGELNVDKLTLLNCVWEIPFDLTPVSTAKYQKELAKEHEEFTFFRKTMSPINKLFGEVGVDFDIVYYSLKDLILELDLTAEHCSYLKRYTN